MENINTPLGELLENNNSRIRAYQDTIDNSEDVNEYEVEALKSRISELHLNNHVIKKLLPTEREVIEKAVDYGQSIIIDSCNKAIDDHGYKTVLHIEKITSVGSTYFTQTFKSYE